jgi:hypothetical protein
MMMMCHQEWPHTHTHTHTHTLLISLTAVDDVKIIKKIQRYGLVKYYRKVYGTNQEITAFLSVRSNVYMICILLHILFKRKEKGYVKNLF